MLPFTPMTSRLLPKAFVADQAPFLLGEVRRRGTIQPEIKLFEGSSNSVVVGTADTASSGNPLQSQWVAFIFEVGSVLAFHTTRCILDSHLLLSCAT